MALSDRTTGPSEPIPPEPLHETFVDLPACGLTPVLADVDVADVRAVDVSARKRAGQFLIVAIVAISGTRGAPARAAGTVPLSPTVVSQRLAGLSLVDYFPSADAWDNMWSHYNPTAIKADFARLAAMHANAVRIIPRVPAFGFPQPNATMLSRLAQTVALAKQYHLRVELTLFDGLTSYADVRGSEQWAAAVLAPYANDPEIVYVDVRNEINRAPAQALTWAQSLLPYVRTVLQGTPATTSITINDGVGSVQSVLRGLRSVRPDLYDVHFYAQEAEAYHRILDVQRLVSPTPVILGETGYSTSLSNASVPGLAQTQASQEAYQDFYLRSVDYAARLLHVSAAPWILNDFTASAWPGASAQLFGLYRADGTPKPSVPSETSYFSGQPVSLAFNQSFETSAPVNGQPEPLLWRIYRQTGTGGTFSADSGVAHTGHGSARISATVGCDSFYLSPIGAISQGSVYTASAYVRGANVTGSTYVSLSWFDANGVYISEATSRNLATGSPGWTQLSATGSAPAGVGFVQIHLKSCNDHGTVWFDDVQFGPTTVSARTLTASHRASRSRRVGSKHRGDRRHSHGAVGRRRKASKRSPARRLHTAAGTPHTR